MVFSPFYINEKQWDSCMFSLKIIIRSYTGILRIFARQKRTPVEEAEVLCVRAGIAGNSFLGHFLCVDEDRF